MLEAPTKTHGARTRRTPGPVSPAREFGDDFARRSRVATIAGEREHADPTLAPRRFPGLRLRLKPGLPGTLGGKLGLGAAAFALVGAVSLGLWQLRSLLLDDPHLVLASSSAIEITGNHHLSRAQLLSVFGEDVDRNLLKVPLADRRTELERLPWVDHATVMRLLPNRMRVAIVERTPIAFVRQGNRIGLVDASGMLLDMDAEGDAGSTTRHDSFPVLTGLSAAEPLAARAARMQLYQRFAAELDEDGGRLSKSVSEVDLSSPEDVRALVATDGADVLVHFGQDDFLKRYRKFEANLPAWRTQYPRLASVDMRYERQVVLEMTPGANEPRPDHVAATPPQPAKATPPPTHAAVHATVHPPARPAVHPTHPVPATPTPVHLTTAFAVPAGRQHTPTRAGRP